MVDGKRTRLMYSSASIISAQFNLQTEAAYALGQQITVRETDQSTRQFPLRNGETQLRPDAGRLTRGQRNAGELRTQSLYST
jgi:hypothetical protein